jgi:hypothetical protein
MTLDCVQRLGTYPIAMDTLYRVHRLSSVLGGKFCRTIGLSSSGPAVFWGPNSPIASVSLVTLINSRSLCSRSTVIGGIRVPWFRMGVEPGRCVSRSAAATSSTVEVVSPVVGSFNIPTVGGLDPIWLFVSLAKLLMSVRLARRFCVPFLKW